MESIPFDKVSPTLPVAPYLGGKRLLAKTVIQRIEQIPHTTYAEPFVGMGGVFLRRSLRPKAEVINDISRDITNLFRILQRHYPQFLDTIKYQIISRAEFNRLVDTRPETLTDLEHAARFLYLQRTAFGGKISGRNFGVAVERPARFNLTNLEPMLEDVHSRLAGVVIECLSEHEDGEDDYGRLSMWRAYGKSTGVGIVLNSHVFTQPSDALKAYTSPVNYLDDNGFRAMFDRINNGLEHELGHIKNMSKEDVVAHVFQMFTVMALCTKHPGFEEEKEWRIYYTPNMNKSKRLKKDIKEFDGAPQPIYKIPLEDIPEEGLEGIAIPHLIDRIIIGPTEFPDAISEAFVDMLTDAGVPDAAKKVVTSDIPLR